MQVAPLAQVVPHVPQLLASDARFVQVPAQSAYGALHTQAPLTHVRLPPQVAPQNPQLPLLLTRSTHAEPAPMPPNPAPPAPAQSVVGARH